MQQLFFSVLSRMHFFSVVFVRDEGKFERELPPSKALSPDFYFTFFSKHVLLKFGDFLVFSLRLDVNNKILFFWAMGRETLADDLLLRFIRFCWR